MRYRQLMAVAALAVALVGTLYVPAPASAVPLATADGSGSSVTDDVVKQIAADLYAAGLVPWAAAEPGSSPTIVHDQIMPKACVNVSRPYDFEGIAAIRRSLSGTPGFPTATAASYPAGSGSVLPALGSGCFDFAESGAGPGPNAAPTDGFLQYIPFARDALTMAVGPSSAIVDSFTADQLTLLYGRGQPVTVGTHRYVPTGAPSPGPPAAGITDISIDLLIPRPASDDRSVFARIVGFNANTLPAWVHDYVTVGGNFLPVDEEDGSAVAVDRNGISLYSIAQYISQSRGFNDRRHGARLLYIDGQPPIAAGKINALFPSQYWRLVYNVIPFADTVPNGPHPTLYRVFVGENPLNPINLCASEAVTIQTFGFYTIPNCGEVVSGLRAFNASQW